MINITTTTLEVLSIRKAYAVLTDDRADNNAVSAALATLGRACADLPEADEPNPAHVYEDDEPDGGVAIAVNFGAWLQAAYRPTEATARATRHVHHRDVEGCVIDKAPGGPLLPSPWDRKVTR